MRAPTASLPDGSLVMTSDIPTDVTARIAYGDPWTILDSARAEGQRLEGFAPECILVYSCAARSTVKTPPEISPRGYLQVCA